MSYDQIKDKINALRSLPDGAISRAKELGEPRSFATIEYLKNQFVSYFDYIFIESYQFYDDFMWSPLNKIVSEFVNIVDRVYSINQNDPEFYEIRASISDSAFEVYAKYVSFVQGIISVSQYNRASEIYNELKRLEIITENNIDNSEVKLNEKIEQIIDQFNKNSENTVKDINEKISHIDSMLESVKVKSEKIFADTEAKYFAKTSNRYGIFSWLWLAGLIFSSAYAIYLANLMLLNSTNGLIKTLTQNEIIVYMSTKAFIFSIVFYLISKCARNYFAALHNYTINNHRANAILSYRALHDITKDSTKRDEILSAVANAVFAPQDSAYAKSTPSVDVPAAVINSISSGVKS